MSARDYLIQLAQRLPSLRVDEEEVRTTLAPFEEKFSQKKAQARLHTRWHNWGGGGLVVAGLTLMGFSGILGPWASLGGLACVMFSFPVLIFQPSVSSVEVEEYWKREQLIEQKGWQPTEQKRHELMGYLCGVIENTTDKEFLEYLGQLMTMVLDDETMYQPALFVELERGLRVWELEHVQYTTHVSVQEKEECTIVLDLGDLGPISSKVRACE